MKVLFGLADIFADDLRKIDPVEVAAQFVGDHFGGHGLSSARRTREERVQSFAERQFAVKTPFAVNAMSMAGLLAKLPDLRDRIRRQNNIAPGMLRLDLASERAQPRARLRAAGGEEVGCCDPPCLGRPPARQIFGGLQSVANLARAKSKGAGENG